MNKEFRNFNFEVRAENNEQYGDFITGRAIVYGSVYDNGYYNEIIERGALDETDLRDVRLLVNHNFDMIPLARSRNNNANSTMQMTVDDDGMNIRANLDTSANADAKALYSATARGDISGMSFAFTVSGEAWDDLDTDKPTRRITAIEKVFEVSAVTFPAYEDTTLEARSNEALESARSALESARAEQSAKLKARSDSINKIKLLCEV